MRWPKPQAKPRAHDPRRVALMAFWLRLAAFACAGGALGYLIYRCGR
jgi:hypothetical protein